VTSILADVLHGFPFLSLSVVVLFVILDGALQHVLEVVHERVEQISDTLPKFLPVLRVYLMFQAAPKSLNDLMQLGVETLNDGRHPALVPLRHFDVMPSCLNVLRSCGSFLARHAASSNFSLLYLATIARGPVPHGLLDVALMQRMA
jgi:hypothetical protein